MDHEEALIRAFVVPEKRGRLVQLLSRPKRREKATGTFAHFRDLDPRYATLIPPGDQHARSIEAILREKGAPDTCYVLSEDAEFDGREMPLGEALSGTHGFGMGTFISCIPGRLAFFEGEDPGGRYVLERPE
ncbi:MAG: hypothetical protein O7C98_09780 [Planctomycetota bacterium]|nr:hypothetical protein [Planctomycetota bacterium]